MLSEQVEAFSFVMACVDLSLEGSSTHECHTIATGKEIQAFQRIVFPSFSGPRNPEKTTSLPAHQCKIKTIPFNCINFCCK